MFSYFSQLKIGVIWGNFILEKNLAGPRLDLSSGHCCQRVKMLHYSFAQVNSFPLRHKLCVLFYYSIVFNVVCEPPEEDDTADCFDIGSATVSLVDILKSKKNLDNVALPGLSLFFSSQRRNYYRMSSLVSISLISEF